MKSCFSIFLSLNLFIFNSYGQDFSALSSSSVSSPFKLRDPFKVPKVNKNKGIENKSLIEQGVFDNSPNAENLRIEGLVLKGIIWQKGNMKRAIFEGRQTGDSVYILKQGTQIANGRVTLKVILPRSVIFVEKIINVYGHPEYLETVISISG